MIKPRILIPVVIQFSIRYILRTGLLRSIEEYATPVILLGWEDARLKREFEDAGAEVHQLPEAKYGRQYSLIKAQMDILFKKRLESPSTHIDHQRNRLTKSPIQRLKSDFRDTYFRSKLSLPRANDRLMADEFRTLLIDTNIHEFIELINILKPDILFSLTPFLNSEQLLLRAAVQCKVPTLTAILSFDNLTTRGWLPIVFDSYLLWNRYNEAELRRAYPESIYKKVSIVGAPQFDFYWDNSYIWDEAYWRKTLGIPEKSPVILFGAGHWSVTPHEIQYLLHLENAIESKAIKHSPVILFRQHPNDRIDRWKIVLANSKHIIYDDPWVTGKFPALTNITRRDIEKLTSTLYHCTIHINVSSTMTIDGAILDRPQIGPAYDMTTHHKYTKVARQLYEREHFLPIVKSGGLDLVWNQEDLVSAVNLNLDDPRRNSNNRRQMIKEIISFDDGQATMRVTMAINEFLRQNVPF